jgi:hypothetical protein
MSNQGKVVVDYKEWKRRDLGWQRAAMIHTPHTFQRKMLGGRYQTETVCSHCIEYSSIENVSWPCETAIALGVAVDE